VPVHRPPKLDAFAGEHCRWEVSISPDDFAVRPDHPNLAVLQASGAAQFEFTLGQDREGGGVHDYAGPYTSGLRLEDFSHAVLVRQAKEFALDVHLLMRAAYLSILQRHGSAVLEDMRGQHLAALAPPLVRRLAGAMGIEGDDLSAIAKMLQLNPLLPDDYASLTVRFADQDTLEVTVLDCVALDDRQTPSPIDTLDTDPPDVISSVVQAVNPRAQIHRQDHHRWHITIDAGAEPIPEHPLAALVGGHNYFEADLQPRPVPVTIIRSER
jgi:hypothetical protein